MWINCGSAGHFRSESEGPPRCPTTLAYLGRRRRSLIPSLPGEGVGPRVRPPKGGSAALRGGKLTHILKVVSEPVGKMITADLASFEDDGPARIEILCPAPAEIDDMSLVFYLGSKGRRLTFDLESPAPVDQLDPASTRPQPGDRGLDDEVGSSEEGSSSEGDDDAGAAMPDPV
ncbi:hypothetical protein ZWY2020_021258 [Hordeum vulgare]|nr:hypothetical protein ZWY2020_021258 [Hordeum vulgare]